MKNKLKITIIQTSLHWKDKEKNIEHFNNLINLSSINVFNSCEGVKFLAVISIFIFSPNYY